MTMPNTEEQLWHFPLCCGAVDGKHVVIRACANTGSQFFNHKGTFSLVLLAVVDAEYCFHIMLAVMAEEVMVGFLITLLLVER